MENLTFEYYLGLLQVQMAILGFVIAGIVALMQILGNARPRRNPNLLIRQPVLLSYMISLGLLLVFVAVGCWVTAFTDDATSLLGQKVVEFYGNSFVMLLSVVLSLLSLFMFAYLTYKARKLMDAREYLLHYAESVTPVRVRRYLADIYGNDDSFSPISEESKHKARPKVLKNPFEHAVGSYDPFQPVREYVKDNAFASYDYGTAAGLKLFSKIFDKTLAEVQKAPKSDEFYYLARYIGESCLEFFSIFDKTSSEKRKLDVIRLVRAKGEKIIAATNDSQGILTVVRSLEDIAKMSNDDDEVIAAITAIHSLTDEYLALHPKAKWPAIAPTFEEICLSVTRISETYYLQKDNQLKAVPIIGHYTGEHRSVTAALVDFFCAYRDLADRYTDTYPQYYFEAIEAVVEVLFARLSEFVSNGRHHIGLNATYNKLAYSLFSLYSVFGLDAIEHGKPELLALSMGNLRRIIKPAKKLDLDEERQVLTDMFVELTLKGIKSLGDVKLKGERTISVYAQETLQKHATAKDISGAIDRLQKEGFDTSAKTVAPITKQLLAINRR